MPSDSLTRINPMTVSINVDHNSKLTLNTVNDERRKTNCRRHMVDDRDNKRFTLNQNK
jgi:hypothetical protein